MIKRIHNMIAVSDLPEEDLLEFTAQLQKLRAEKEALMAQPSTLKKPPHLDANAAHKFLKHMEEVFKCSNGETKRAMLRDCVNAVSLNHDELRVRVTYTMPAAILSATDPGAIAEVCGHRFGSGGRIPQVLQRFEGKRIKVVQLPRNGRKVNGGTALASKTAQSKKCSTTAG